jgi:hypothetical protein
MSIINKIKLVQPEQLNSPSGGTWASGNVAPNNNHSKVTFIGFYYIIVNSCIYNV